MSFFGMFKKGSTKPIAKMLSTTMSDLQSSMVNGEKYFREGINLAQQNKHESAIEYFSKSIDCNDGASGPFLNRGVVYHQLGMYEKAVKDYKKAIELETVEDTGSLDIAKRNLSLVYELIEDTRLEVDNFALTTSLAKSGDAEAQNNLGLLYANGEGVAQDIKQAAEWYRKAAAQGHAEAQVKLGMMYDLGYGVAQDYKQALEWIRKAAVQGHAKAQYNLGFMYSMGQGIAKDKVLAYMLYNLSAANADPLETLSRERIVIEMTPEQIEEGQELSANWKPGTPLPEKSKTGASGSSDKEAMDPEDLW